MVDQAASTAFAPLILRLVDRYNICCRVYVRQLRATAVESASFQGRAAFICGLPVNVTAPVLRAHFSQFGQIQEIVLHDNQASGVIVFQEPAALRSLLTFAHEGNELELSTVSGQAPAGVKALVEQHKQVFRPKGGNNALVEALNKAVLEIEAEQQRQQEAAAKSMEDDGWTLVVSKGQRRAGSHGGSAVQGVSKRTAQAAAGRKQQQTIDNFYRFQRKEKARNALLELRHKFEEDKRRIQQLRAARNFKPS